MIKESKYCCGVMKKHFKKEFVMTKEENKNFKNSAKCWIYDNDYVVSNFKVRDNCHINGKCRGFAHRDYNINFKLNQKFLLYFTSIEILIPISFCKN